MFLFSLALFVLAALNWYFVFNNKAREKLSSFAYSFYRLDREDRDMYDALGLAGHVIAATVFSVLFFAVVFLRISEMFR